MTVYLRHASLDVEPPGEVERTLAQVAPRWEWSTWRA